MQVALIGRTWYIVSMKDKETIKLVIEGVLLGDACGVPYEFKPASAIDSVSFLHTPDFARAHAVPDGTWSDDGACTLALLDSLLSCGGLNLNDFGQNLIDWYDFGKYQPDNYLFDIGGTTAKAILNIKQGVPASKAGIKTETSKSNGSLMRCSPISLFYDTPKEIIKAAGKQSLVTHSHPEVILACQVYALWLHYEILGCGADSLSQVKKYLNTSQVFNPQIMKGSGYYKDSMCCAKYIMERATSYKQAVEMAIKFGNDTDTTAAIVGALAAARFKELPSNWLKHLRQKEIYTKILDIIK
jgi:ADP-ribosyl-[dinitrogen reductase] hydrolase